MNDPPMPTRQVSTKFIVFQTLEAAEADFLILAKPRSSQSKRDHFVHDYSPFQLTLFV